MIRSFQHSLVLSGLFVLVGMNIGCHSDTIPVHPVTGTITYKGENIEGATIMFVPSNSNGYEATAITDANGMYSLTTPSARRGGAVVGSYNVFIEKTIVVDRTGKPIAPESTIYVPDITKDPSAYVPASAADNSRVPITRSMLPAKYNNINQPLLTATVQRGKNVFIFDLED